MPLIPFAVPKTDEPTSGKFWGDMNTMVSVVNVQETQIAALSAQVSALTSQIASVKASSDSDKSSTDQQIAKINAELRAEIEFLKRTKKDK